MEIKEGNRKIAMLRETRIWVVLLTIAYIIGCWLTDSTIDSMVFITCLGVIGAGHATANIANGMEHRNS